MSVVLYLILLAATGLERLVEMVVAKRNAAWSLAHGGQEIGAGHFPVMVVLHTAFLGGAAAEVLLLDRPFLPMLGIPALILALLCQVLRWWCIVTLGRQWNTRILVVPGMPRITHGPYRWFSHPNYVAVVLEGIALPLVHGAWITAAAFTIANAVLLRHRIRLENEALELLDHAPDASV